MSLNHDPRISSVAVAVPGPQHKQSENKVMELLNTVQTRAEFSARELLYGTRLFFPTRNAYQRVFRRERWLFWKSMLDLYTPFVNGDSLVFDIGANMGLYSEIFLQLGARVIAVEPNEQCHPQLKRLASGYKMTLEPAACGARPGKADLHLSDSSGICTLSSEWVDITRQSDLYADAHWVGVRSVPITTLDALAVRYGTPTYIKIDVEGYEDDVLAGMTFKPHSLSFEYHTSLPQVASACLARLADDYIFNYIVGNDARFELPQWVKADEMQHVLSTLPSRPDFGDIYALCCSV